MKFVVTGGAGFIGSHLVEYLIKQNHDVIIVDNLHSGKIKNLDTVKDKIDFFEIDIRNFSALKNLVKGVDGIFHQAALTVVQESYVKEKEYYDVNVIGTENILKLAKEFGIKVVFASSSSVYGNPKKIPISEDADRKPLNPYGLTKLEDEYLAERYSKMGVEIIGLRYFNVYGLGQNDAYAGVITKFLKNIKMRKPPIINGDGTQVRDFISVQDVAEANLLAMKHAQKNLFLNVGTGKATTILDLTDMIIRSSGLKLHPIFAPSLEGDVKTSQADIELVTKLFGWKPKVNLADWLNQTIPKMMTSD